jgi:hypothetical protein
MVDQLKLGSAGNLSQYVRRFFQAGNHQERKFEQALSKVVT